MWLIFNSTNLNPGFPPYNFNSRKYYRPLIKTSYNLHRPSAKDLPHFINFNCVFLYIFSISGIILRHRFIANLISTIETCTPFKPFHRFEMWFSTSTLYQWNGLRPSIWSICWSSSLKKRIFTPFHWFNKSIPPYMLKQRNNS